MGHGKSRSYSREDGGTKGYGTNILGMYSVEYRETALTGLEQRIEPFGWDSEDRTYFVLDDNRLYRRTDPPPPPPPAAKPKKNSKKAKASRRASKRRKISEAVESEAEHHEQEDPVEPQDDKKEYDGFGGMTWECVAITLDEFTAFLALIQKSRDPNEKILRSRIMDDVLPLLEKQEEARKRKQAQKERELLNLEKLAHAKRSSRIADKLEHQKQEEEAREAERKKQAELAMAKKEQEKWKRLEKERESRMQTREQRLKEREARRILHEDELSNLSEDSKKLETGQARLSERHLKAEIERKKQALEELTKEEEDWIFDCICGAYGQIDDGTHSIACDKCNVWQHSKCVGVSQAQAERADFHFVCKTCEDRAKEAERARAHPTIKIKFNRPGSASSTATTTQNNSPANAAKTNGTPASHLSSPKKFSKISPTSQISSFPQSSYRSKMSSWQNGPASSTQNTHNPLQSHSFPQMHPPSASGPQSSPQRFDQMKSVVSGSTPNPGASGFHALHQNNGSPAMSPFGGVSRPPSFHVFSSPHPHSPTSLPPPGQPPVYTFVNGNASQSRNNISSERRASQSNKVMYTPTQGSSFPSSNGYSPSAETLPPPRPSSSESQHRHALTNFSSPLTAAPVLTPITKGDPMASFNSSSSPTLHPTPHLYPKSSPPQADSFGIVQTGDSALPSAVTGLSPTKHSPPRPSTSNGSFGSATPSILPPIMSLSPSPQLQNLTPPVKHSEPEVIRSNGQTVGP